MVIRPRVLLAEPNREWNTFLSAMLFEQGYEVLSADTGAEAVRMAQSHCPEIILLELELPDMGGMQVLSSIREWSLQPVIILSEHADAETIAQALDAYADDYMIKPVREVELLARMRAALRHTRTGTGDLRFANEGQLVIGRLTVDYNKYRVYVDEIDAGLTQNEFRMVGLLARYNGKVLTYKQVMQEIWGPNAGNDNQILRVNMTNIRRKIEDDALQPKYLFTENGVGYRMISQEEAAQWKPSK